jgi:hypothetical protein
MLRGNRFAALVKARLTNSEEAGRSPKYPKRAQIHFVVCMHLPDLRIIQTFYTKVTFNDETTFHSSGNGNQYHLIE